MIVDFTTVPARSVVRGVLILLLFAVGVGSLPALAATGHVSEANLVLPDLRGYGDSRGPRPEVRPAGAYCSSDC